MQYENECDYVEATIAEFNQWLAKKKANSDNNTELFDPTPFDDFDLNDNWGYADYKYMVDFVDPNKQTINPNVN